MAQVRLITSPYFSPPVPVDTMERLYLYRGVRLELEMDLSVEPSYYCLEYEEGGTLKRAYFPLWYDVEAAVNDILTGRAKDYEVLPLIKDSNDLGDAVNV